MFIAPNTSYMSDPFMGERVVLLKELTVCFEAFGL